MHRRRTALPSLLVLLVLASCSEPVAPDPAARFSESGEYLGEVIINDVEWVDRTVEETPVEIPAAEGEHTSESETQSASAQAFALTPEPIIRVGVVYSELGAATVRIGGKDNTDPYELRSGSATGPVIASGLLGETVATRIVSGGVPTIRLTLPNGAVVSLPSGGAALLRSASGYVRIRRFTSDGSYYRGTAEVRFNSTRSALVGVNQLPIEQYLYGVVPRELGPIAFPEIEALKTQAISARTYARRRIQFCGASRCGHGYHIIPTTGDQVYGSAGGEHPLSTQAVDETRGVVGTYNGGLIEALYSSTSGGWTANSEDVFINALPYLRSVPDHERGNAMDHVPSLEVFRNHANPINLRNEANGDFEADWSRYHRWYVSWSVEEMRQVAGRVGSATFIDPGKVYEINVVSRSSSGRIFEIQFVTEKRGTLVARKDAVRSALRYVTYNSSGAMVLNSLRSTLVFVEPVRDPSTKEIVGWEAWGGGWGHGVGMNQTGAVGMAEKGRTHPEILAHYYRGVVLETRW